MDVNQFKTYTSDSQMIHLIDRSISSVTFCLVFYIWLIFVSKVFLSKPDILKTQGLRSFGEGQSQA